MALKKVIVNASFLGVKTIQISIRGNIVSFPSKIMLILLFSVCQGLSQNYSNKASKTPQL